ncbi:hypothetical protein SARC_10844 [Sphaeroforma arctica JP610]|uniref:Copper homeostasis protein cutC homolog n=1 Tax=Sphaeroforma arctica JP610 TaxID=667725 RepID=A0A0L0FJM8_9EUKA|nr:hypothetical protein SARC_10844 [Sphaeroforma arctica JP610]KNC76666.1 hypothetical protein SARC_10844 [Sphaeroforma arctica JP610]|eukprot:XP_014150568.1 hypothetical protein SARC_10844 [Sphaeroforma arctica JP610]
MPHLEICANSVQSAINAQTANAYRVELCDNLWEGGTTPSGATVRLARKHLTSTLLNVLIRPRGGDFCYSDVEFETCKEDIKLCKEWGVDGIVCGVLKSDFTIDATRTHELIKLAKPLPFTFHRAFDLCSNLDTALHTLIELGVDRVLSSGGASSVREGLQKLQHLNKNIAANKIIIMPGGGVTDNNVQEFMDVTGCEEFHCSAKVGKQSKMDWRLWNGVPMNSSEDIPEDVNNESNLVQIKKVLTAMDNRRKDARAK